MRERRRTHSHLWLVAVCLFGAGGCGKAQSPQAGFCRAERHERPADSPSAVRQVDVYWDVSASMKSLLTANVPQGKQKKGAFAVLWNELDSGWLRSDVNVAEVRHHAVGTSIRDLVGAKAIPALADVKSDLPRTAFELGTILSASEERAAVFISDMRVDIPDGKQGEPLCGSVPIPMASAVPALFGQCLVAAWSASAPVAVDLRAIVLRRPTLREGERPLFVLVASRSAAFSSTAVGAVTQGLAEYGSEDVTLVSDRAAVACAEIDRCAYPRRSDVVERHVAADGSRACSFYVPAATSQHGLRCRFGTTRAAPAGLVSASYTGKIRSSSQAAAKAFDEGVDLLLPLERLASGRTNVEFELQYEWRIGSDVQQRLSSWIGDSWGNDPEYKRFWMGVLQALEPRIQQRPPVCDAVWSIPYDH